VPNPRQLTKIRPKKKYQDVICQSHAIKNEFEPSSEDKYWRIE